MSTAFLPGSLVLDFAGRIAACVTRTGLNQTKVGREIGVTRSAVSQWVSGTSEPTAANALALARLARVRVEWLVLGEEPMEYSRVKPELLATLLQVLENTDDLQVREVIKYANYRKDQDGRE